MIWLVAVAVYVLAVFHRSSLGVAGLLAAERFHITASELAAFTVLQLFVYAGLQVPNGIMIDRFGPRAMLVSGAVLMTAGQFAFALADSYPAALAARALIGAGDAVVFTSVLRLVVAWFRGSQAPFLTQLTGQLGQLGAVAAAGPLAFALHHLGWTRAFGAASALGVFLLIAVLLAVRDSPDEDRAAPPRLAVLLGSMRGVWSHPGVRLGLWIHFTAQLSMHTFAMLWGYPFLVAGQGLSPAVASTILMAMTGWVVVSGLALARLTTRFPFQRSWLAVVVVSAIAATWTVVLLWPGRAPLSLLVLLALVTATGGPASMIGFDVARTFMPSAAIGRANGVINIGGFLAALLLMGAVGWILDLRADGPAATYRLADFKVAMAAQYPFWAVGVWQILRCRRRAINHLRQSDPSGLERLRRGESVEFG
ncbi:MAG: MFS transporter [Aeromicrobium sp.]|uniref:MFS transporter n=1 Tax=Aeromicrobium sp. TaxID=1871063 RepID=UPI0039E3A4F6